MNPIETPLIKILGIGSPIVDILTKVNDAFIMEHSTGMKGGMQIISPAQQQSILDAVPGEIYRSAGGSAGNTIYAMARLGAPTAFMGMIGDDETGNTYKAEFAALECDVSRMRATDIAPTATCLSLITPDSERTMRTCLGAAACLKPEDITAADFEGVTHVHLEGYLLLNRPLIERILTLAYDAECVISLDLASFEVIRATKSFLPDLIRTYVNIVFANEDETREFAPNRDTWQDGFVELKKLCPTVCVKLGARGAVIHCVDETVNVKAAHVQNVTDTTAAGDLWAAGFLYGYLQNYPLAECGRCASLLSGAVIQIVGTGASIADETWEDLMRQLP